MIERPPEYERAIARSAERQMRRWAMRLEREQPLDRQEALSQLPERVRPYVAISRVTGAGGGEIARRVGEALGWEVYGKELLDYMAEKFELPHASLQSVDETTASWFTEVLGKWFDSRVVTQTEYLSHLAKVVLLAASENNAVFLGRGVQFFLPRQRGLAVQIIAPLEKRIERVVERCHLGDREAREYIEKTDQGRRDFIRFYFHRDSASAYLYDLVINLAHSSIDDAVELVLQAARQRFKPELAAAGVA